MHAFPLYNDEDLRRAMALVDSLWDATPGTPEHDLLDVMSSAIDVYETSRRNLPPPDPVALITYKLAELGWSQNELARRLGWGSSGRVSEILGRKRGLTLSMVRALSQVLGIPPGLLVHDRRDVPDGSVLLVVRGDLAHQVQLQATFYGVSFAEVALEAIARAVAPQPGPADVANFNPPNADRPSVVDLGTMSAAGRCA